jgi:hypothetical protein
MSRHKTMGTSGMVLLGLLAGRSRPIATRAMPVFDMSRACDAALARATLCR